MNPLEKAEKATELQLSMLAEKQPPLSPLIQETFETIFKEFAQRALKSSDEAACPLIDRLIRIATILDPALRQNQSFFVEKGATVISNSTPKGGGLCATKAVIDIAQKLIEALDEVCALSVNVTWTLNQSSTNSTYRISVPATPTTPLEPEKLWDIPPAEVLDELLGKP